MDRLSLVQFVHRFSFKPFIYSLYSICDISKPDSLDISNGSNGSKHSAVRRGFSLVEMLVVIVIIVALAAFILPNYLGKGSGKPGEPKTPMSAAHDSECLQNIGSVRQCIKAEEATDDEKHPASLAAIKSLTSELRACPVGKEPYSYDPKTGEVHCVHPGHERY